MNTPTIQDDALYPGHVVRQLLEEAGTHLPATAWMDTATAAGVLDMSEDWLRKRCQRWAVMARPPVRVQKTSAGRMAHWRLCDEDVYALARKRGAGAPEPGREGESDADATAVRVPRTGDLLADTVAHLQDVVTRNLTPGLKP